jgi:hypothetical protein
MGSSTPAGFAMAFSPMPAPPRLSLWGVLIMSSERANFFKAVLEYAA